MRPTKFGVGQSVKRVEDVRLVSGRGNYASDAVDKAELKAVFLRSPYGHAKFRIDDIEAARASPGVRAVYVAGDFASLGGLPCLAPVPNADGSKTPLKPYPVMTTDEAQHVGDIVAMVVADTTLQARDAAELISVTWEELPAAVDMEEAIRPGAPLVFVGGVFTSIQFLPPAVRHASLFNPMFYMIDAFRFAYTGTSDIPLRISTAVVIVLAVVAFAVALRLVHVGFKLRT